MMFRNSAKLVVSESVGASSICGEGILLEVDDSVAVIELINVEDAI